MKKRVYISYDWRNREERRWLFWLEKKLEKLGLEVTISAVEKIPRAQSWLATFQSSLGIDMTYVISNDPGCLTLLSYITKLVEQNNSQKILLLAGQPKNQKSSTQSRPLLETTRAVSTHISSLQQSNELALIASGLDTHLIVVYDGTADISPDRLQDSVQKLYLR